MSRFAVRLSLLVICVAASSGAAFFLWSSTRDTVHETAAFRQFELNVRSARVSVEDLRGAQQSYVAVGQGEDFWFARADTLHKEITDQIGALRPLARAASTAAELETAATALQEFMQMDLRAREY